MSSNRLLKWLVLPLLVVGVIVGVRMCSHKDSSGAVVPGVPPNPLSPDELKSLGIGGDTTKDTLATLVGQVKELRGQVETAVKENKVHKTENDRLRQSERTIDQRIQNAIATERDRLAKERQKLDNDQEQTTALVKELQRKLDSAGTKPPAKSSDLPIGLGLDDDESPPTYAPQTLKWIEPDDVRPASKSVGSKRTSFGETTFKPAVEAVHRGLDNAAETIADSGLKPVSMLTAKPVYTVPANSTLTGSVAMTALIGRVPIDGTVHDAYPFKVLIGAENLVANGIEIPDVAGAVASGTASGDWTLSCVRGEIRSLTFVFTDGTVRTIGTKENGKADARTDGGLGWISDPYGLPCVTGERHSNAQQYLGSQALITAAGAGAASLIKSDNGSASFVTGTNGNVVGTVGISGNEAMGRILAGGVQEMSQWVSKLYGQAFAAVFVAPGADVAVHIEQPLNIDYEPHGRKVNYRLGDGHDSDLE